MLIFGAEGLVSVLCSHLFQDITAPEPSQSQIIYPCEGLIKQDSTIIPILQVVEGGRERVSKIPSLWQKHIWGRKLSLIISVCPCGTHIPENKSSESSG